MKTTNIRFSLLLVLTTLMGCALGHASSSPTVTASSPEPASSEVAGASARHVVAFAE